MKFYQVSDEQDSTIGCATSVAAARKIAKDYSLDTYTVTRIVVGVSAREALRRLIGSEGGYASETTEILRVESGRKVFSVE